MLLNVQIGRAVAAIMVVLFHIASSEKKDTSFHTAVEPFYYFGFSGVDLFFVISGFIIYWTGRNYMAPSDGAWNISGSRTFLWHRISRIYPVYILFALVVLLLLTVAKSNALSLITPESVFREITIMLNAGRHFILLPVAWTLAYELYFYFMFSVYILLPRSIASLFWRAAIAAHIILMTFYSSWSSESGILAFIVNPLHMEFFFGVLIGIAASKSKLNLGWLSCVAGCGLFAVGAAITFYLERQSSVEGFTRLFTFGLGSAFVLAGLVALELRRPTHVPKIFTMLGDASYSIYLCHLIILAIIRNLVARFYPNSYWAHAVSILVVIGLVILIGMLSYKFVERPTMRILRRIGPKAVPALPARPVSNGVQNVVNAGLAQAPDTN